MQNKKKSDTISLLKKNNTKTHNQIIKSFFLLPSWFVPYKSCALPLILPDQPVANYGPVPVDLVVPLGIAARAPPHEGAEGEPKHRDGESYQEQVARPVVVVPVVVAVPVVVVRVRHALLGELQAYIIVKYRLLRGRRRALGGQLLDVDIDSRLLHVYIHGRRLHVYVDGSGLDVYVVVVGVDVARI